MSTDTITPPGRVLAYTVRVPASVHERIKRVAARERRSINSEAVVLWEEALAIHERREEEEHRKSA